MENNEIELEEGELTETDLEETTGGRGPSHNKHKNPPKNHGGGAPGLAPPSLAGSPGGIISNKGSGFFSDNGSGLISNKGGGAISDNGAGFTSR